MGQVYSLIRLYQQDIKTEFIYHGEDDFCHQEFGFLKPSYDILKQHPEVIQVSLRGMDCNSHPLVDDSRFPFKIQQPEWREGWGGFSFNNTLMRLSDMREAMQVIRTFVGQHGLRFELALSKHFAAKGRVIATLPGQNKQYRPFIVHTGGGRSRAIEPIPAWEPKLLIAVPTCQRLEYGRWQSEDSPQYDPATNSGVALVLRALSRAFPPTSGIRIGGARGNEVQSVSMPVNK